MRYFSERFNKRTFLNLSKTIVFVLVIAILFFGFSQLFMPKTNKDMRDKSANGFLGEPENTIDILIVGDSESYSSFIPLQMWNEYGITSYVCGTPSQTLDYSLDFLRKAFVKQKPKFVVLETNAVFRAFSVKTAILTRADQWFSIYRYHDRWKKISLRDFHFKVENNYIENDKGYRMGTETDAADFSNYMKPTKEKINIHKKNKAYVDKIARLCSENGAELIFISTPSTKNWNFKKHNAIAELSREMNLEYIDLNIKKEVPIDWSKDTKDKGDHLNYSGAVKVTGYLGAFFNQKGKLEDHRHDSNYAEWGKAYNHFQKTCEKIKKSKEK